MVSQPGLADDPHSSPFATEIGPDGTFSVGPIPEWAREIEVPWETPSLHDEHLLWLLSDSQYSHIHAATYERSVRRLISAEAVQKLAQVEIDYDPEVQNLEVHSILLWRQDQCQEHADPRRFFFRQREKQMDAQILHGRVSAIMIVDDVRPGDSLEIRYSLRTTRQLPGKKVDNGFLLERACRTAAWHVSFHLPHDTVPHYRQSDGDRMEPEVLDLGDAYIWSWTGSQAAAPLEEFGIPIWEPFLRWAQISGYESWGEVARLMDAHWSEIAGQAADCPALVAEITAGAETLEDQALRVLRWVQDNVRYLGMEMGLGAILPSTPDETIRRRYGDCKDKSLLLCALLRTLGIEASPVLVHTAWRGEVAGHLPGLSSFNHAIATYTVNGRRGFADPTMLGAGGGLFDQCMPNYEQGLCIDTDNDDLTAIDHAAKDQSLWLVREEFFLDHKGPGSRMTQKIEATGFEAEMLRTRLSMVGREGFAREDAENLQRYFPDLRPGGTVKVTDHRDRNHLLLEADYEFGDWGKLVNKKLRAFSYDARWIAQFLSCPADHGPRRRNFMLRFPSNIRHEVVIHGRLVPGPSEEFIVDSRWFLAKTDVEWKDKTVKLSYSYQAHDRLVLSEWVPEYCKRFQKMVANMGCNTQVKWSGPEKVKLPPSSDTEPPAPKERQPAGFEPVLSANVAEDTRTWFKRRPGNRLNKGMSQARGIFQKAWIPLVILFGIQMLLAIVRLADPASSPSKAAQSRSIPSATAPETDPRAVIPPEELKGAETAIQAGDVLTAEARLRELEQRYPENLSIHMGWAALEILRNNPDEALRHLNLVLAAAPDHPQALIILSSIYMNQRRYAQAEETLRRVIEQYPQSIDACMGLGKACLAQGKAAEAEQLFRQVLSIDPGNLQALHFAAEILVSRNDPQEACRLIDVSIERFPGNASFYALKALVVVETDPGQALELINQAIKITPGIPVLVAQRALILAKLNRSDEAVESIRAALTIAPENYEVNDAAGMILSLAGKLPEALAAQETCIRLNPGRALLYNRYGYTLMLAGRNEEAATQLKKAVEMEPTLGVAWENLRNLALQTGDTGLASQYEIKIRELKAASAPSP